MKKHARKAASEILVIDAGGTNIKIFGGGRKVPVKIPSGPTMTARRMVALVKRTARDWDYARVSIGFPGPVVNGRSASDPINLGRGWKGFDFRKAFGRPVKILNDAAMQALGSYRGGRMLFVGFGTGMGSALIVDGVIQPLEMGQMPYKNGKTFEDYVGRRGLEKLGKKRWRAEVAEVVALLKFGLQAQELVLGGGNVKKLKEIPAGARLGNNRNALIGGLRLWDDEE
jgi:predicted NBD/HSP70 family sugar kinase